MEYNNCNNIEKFEKLININDIKVGDKVAKLEVFNFCGYCLRYFEVLEVSRITPKRTKIYYKEKSCADELRPYDKFYLVTDELKNFSEENKLRYFLFKRMEKYVSYVIDRKKLGYTDNDILLKNIKDYVLNSPIEKIKEDMECFYKIDNIIKGIKC